ncbi:stalk domain-containing protein [Desulfallas thermosapovorans]|uniref:Copper amine oxidase-like protein n=1 Tax=Desulfallas thermosapovorans DSM 6562 TaxID=1121431 RepID=A0A5S4ZPP2_9FIRM|nr:stalk domain-containing protein [Desulfallas thermosapovorans]TYO94524.1 copper amine oxidase-like protein [Desulfallas thermosapovorans DSM 6562]
MKKLTILISLIIALTMVPLGSFANEPVSEKSITVQDCIVKLIYDNENNPQEEANFYGLRHICESFGYDVEWDSGQNYAIVTGGNGKTLTDTDGNNIDALVIRPGAYVIELLDERNGKLDELPAGYEPFIENNRLYVHSSVFEKYFGLKAVID